MIILMTLKHVEQVVQMEHALFSSPWPADAFQQELNENKFARYYVWLENQKVLGYCGVWLLFDQAQITNIGVSQEAQRQGIGQKLMETMIDTAIEGGCETISLEVRVSNHPAISLYQKLGFDVVSLRKGYYQDNHEDAFLMVKAIGGLKV